LELGRCPIALWISRVHLQLATSLILYFSCSESALGRREVFRFYLYL
jgi:hypothetical protein